MYILTKTTKGKACLENAHSVLKNTTWRKVSGDFVGGFLSQVEHVYMYKGHLRRFDVTRMTNISSISTAPYTHSSMRTGAVDGLMEGDADLEKIVDECESENDDSEILKIITKRRT